MKLIKYIAITVLIFSNFTVIAQKKETKKSLKQFPVSKLTIEPGIGIKPAPQADLLLSNVVQWNIKKRLSITSHSAISFNSPFERNFNYIQTNYNYSLMQRFGIGTSLYTRKSSHTFSLMGGIKYDAYKETLNNPEFEKVTVALNSSSPDFGLMYNLKIGQKKFFFSYRMYIPLYPYPVKGMDFQSIDGNLANISVELGLGIRLNN